MGDGESLPHAHVKRIIKAKLAELTAGDAGDAKRDISVQKEALAAFAEAAKIFIHYLTATANDVCHESKRRTINAEDVLKAVDEVEFAEFAEPMREALAGACSTRKREEGSRRREGSRRACTRQAAAPCARAAPRRRFGSADVGGTCAAAQPTRSPMLRKRQRRRRRRSARRRTRPVTQAQRV